MRRVAWWKSRPLVSSIVLLLIAFTSAGAAPWVSLSAQLTGAPQGAAAGPPQAFKLEDSTPVKLRLQRTISSADAHVDERIDFDVLEEIKVNDILVIPKGSIAWGTVTEAQPKRRMGRGGKLNVNIDAVRLADGERAALRGAKDMKGGGHTGAMTGGIVATSIVFFPAAPLFLLMHGKDISIPKGTEITVYINGDMELNPSKFGVTPAADTPATPAAALAQQPLPADAGELATVILKSTPEGADITVDGKYVGSAPASLRLTPGDHTVTIEKSGYRAWQRTISLSPGGINTIDATLERP